MNRSQSLLPSDLRNPARPTHDLSAERDALLAHLLFASRRLADQHVVDCTLIMDPEPRVMCLTCGANGPAARKSGLEHHGSCAAGEVLGVLLKLLETVAVKEQKRAAAAEFQEPWQTDPEFPTVVVMPDEYAVCDLSLSDLAAEDDARYAARIVACVNACTGIPTERLERLNSRSLMRQAANQLAAGDAVFCEAPQAKQEGGAR